MQIYKVQMLFKSLPYSQVGQNRTKNINKGLAQKP